MPSRLHRLSQPHSAEVNPLQPQSLNHAKPVTHEQQEEGFGSSAPPKAPSTPLPQARRGNRCSANCTPARKNPAAAAGRRRSRPQGSCRERVGWGDDHPAPPPAPPAARPCSWSDPTGRLASCPAPGPSPARSCSGGAADSSPPYSPRSWKPPLLRPLRQKLRGRWTTAPKGRDGPPALPAAAAPALAPTRRTSRRAVRLLTTCPRTRRGPGSPP